MNETVVYNVWHLKAYGSLVLAYFFLGGASGGAFLVSAFAKIFGKERYRAIADIGSVVSVILLFLGVICLLLDLEHPLRSIYMIIKFNPTSPICWGLLIIGLFSLCSLIYLYYQVVAKNDKLALLWAGIGMVFAIGLTSYTGLLLSMAKARPLWHSAIMAPLFLVSSGISGLAFVMLVANLLGKYSPKDEVMVFLRKSIVVLIIIDIFFLSDMYVLYIGIAEAQEVALLLIAGKFAFLFWGLELLLGSIIPIIILSTGKLANTRRWQVAASLLSLMGVFCMRYIIIIVGQYLPLS